MQQAALEIRARRRREQERLDRELEQLLDGPQPAPKPDAAPTARRDFSLNEPLQAARGTPLTPQATARLGDELRRLTGRSGRGRGRQV